MRIKWFRSTLAKMTVFYIVFGMIPLILISMMFFHWYHSDVEETTISNYSQISEYVGRNLSSLIVEADDTTGYMYDFSIDGYEHLYEILYDEGLEPVEKNILMNEMLQDMMIGNETISSLRFCTREGEVYALFRAQGKSIQDGKEILNEIRRTEDTLHSMLLMPAVSEKDYYTNTEDMVFTIARNYMNTMNTHCIQTDCMGTLYVDINVEEIRRLVESVEVGENGNIYVLDPATNQWLFSSSQSLWGNGEIARRLVEPEISEVISFGGGWYFCQQIQHTDYYVALQVFSEDVLDTYSKNQTFINLILIFAILMLLLTDIIFLNKMNEPIRKLVRAMEQVQTGNLNVQVESGTNDEMGYLSEGFNKMVNDLSAYVEEVYVANIRQKEAELNALKMQIQPHYLYNTLEIIRMTAVEHADGKTARLLESLAKQMRYLLGKQKERVPLYMEMNSIREYIVLMNARYHDRLRLNVNVSDQDRGLYVLKLLLQPIVENCIKHGLKEKEGVGTIEVNVKRTQDCLEIVVMDDGMGMPEENERHIRKQLGAKEAIEKSGGDKVGIGLKNVYDRIKFTCGEEYGFEVTSVEHIGTMVKFRLPVWEEENNAENGNS